MKISTDRILLRALDLNDAEAFFSYRSSPLIYRYQYFKPRTLNDAKTFIKNNSKTFNIPGTWYQLAIIDKKTEKLIGDLGVHFVDKDQCEIGCTISEMNQGKGYATESLTAFIDYLFTKTGKHRIFASVDPENEASTHLFKRLGFRLEAHFVKSVFLNNNWVNDLVFAILNEEWNYINNTDK